LAPPQPLGDIRAHLQGDRHGAGLQRLRVGVGADEIHALDVGAQHVLHRVAAAAAHADDLDHFASFGLVSISSNIALSFLCIWFSTRKFP
jgi:hypothetical protein